MMDIRDFLISNGIWEREVDEVMEAWEIDEDTEILEVFSSTYDLGEDYIDNCVGSLDYYIDACVDREELGEYVAANGDEYLLLSSGRIVEFR